MRTVSQLSKLTGVSRRTIQYYANERIPGKSREGSGIIAPCCTGENGYRYFDDDALFKLLTIMTLKQCGYKPSDIRMLIESNSFDIAESADIQIKALERAKRDLDQQIKFTKILKLFGMANQDDDEKAVMTYILLALEMIFISIEQVIREYDPDFVVDPDSEAVKDILKQQKGEQSASLARTYMKMLKDAEKGELDLSTEVVSVTFEDTLKDGSDIDDDVLSRIIFTLGKLFKADAEPQCKKTQQYVGLLFQELCPQRRFIELKATRWLINRLMSGTYVAILAELLFGEGFAEYIEAAFDSYYTTAKERIEKKRSSFHEVTQDRK